MSEQPKIEWQLKMSLSGSKEHSLLYRSEYKGQGIQMEIHTPKHKNGKFGKQKEWFFIDGDKREFENMANMIKAIDEAVINND